MSTVKGKEVEGRREKKAVPVSVILDKGSQAVLVPYCNTIISTLQALHPATPVSSPLLNFENESGSQITGGPGDDLWLEDEEEQENWESLSKGFTQGEHATTLFSVISLNPTPNLEAFWRETSAKFPQNLVFSSLAPPPGVSFQFPLFAASHACFLVGFYNSRAQQPPPQVAGATPQTSAVSTPQPANAGKRVAANDQNSANKKQKTANPTPSVASGAPAVPNAQIPPGLPGKPGEPPSSKAQSQILALAQAQAAALAQRQASNPNPGTSPTINASPNPSQPGSTPRRPDVPLPPGIATENLQQYINDMKLATSRQPGAQPNPATMGQPAFSAPPPQPANFATGQQPNQAQVHQQNLQQAQQQLLQAQQAAQQQAGQAGQQNRPLPNVPPVPRLPPPFQHLTPAQIDRLPPIPEDMKAKIEAHMLEIRNRVGSGQLKNEEAQDQVKRLQDLANSHRVQLAQKQMAAAHALQQAQQAQQAQQNGNNPNQGQAQNQTRPRNPSQPQGQPFPNAPAGQQPSQQQQQFQQQQQQQFANQPQGQLQNPPQPPQPQRANSGPVHGAPMWNGPIVWQINDPAKGFKQECVVYCQAAPMQESAIRDLAEITFPQALRISSLIPLQMNALQELAVKHTLPAVTIKAVPDERLGKEIKDRLGQMSGGRGNEEMYKLFAQSMEARSEVGLIKFPVAKTGIVMVSMPKRSNFIGIVFTKIPIPDEWLALEANARANQPGLPLQQNQPPPPFQQPPMMQQQPQPQQQQQQQQQFATQQFAQQFPPPPQLQQQPQFNAQFNPYATSQAPGQPAGMSFAEIESISVFRFSFLLRMVTNVNKAKVMAADDPDGTGEAGPHYLVHYKGWKQTWDEWVTEDRLKKFNEENIKKQKALIEAQRARDNAERIAQLKATEAENAKKQSAGASGPGGPSSGAGGRGQDPKRGAKRGRDGELQEEEYMRRPEIKITIPDVLKTHLVDDWEAITKNNQLVRLPREPNVDIILDEWNKFHQNEEPETRRLTAEVSAGLRLYFNKALGNNLLYRFERGQYQDMMKKITDEEAELSSIYGAEHLLRLFVNLPELLAHTAMDPDTVMILKTQMSSFLGWMTLNQHMLFDAVYDNTASGYQNNNKN
ncbi:hypothetical protein MNV49_005084 [Pseudohyphozyma bogoriensis]|nr:hypothetical protein MNV49_005084 [Pseudohyphozyma bogoriensis]